MKNIIYLLGIVLLISCSVHKEQIMQLNGQDIIVNKKPNYEYLDCKVYPEVVYKNQKRRDINIYLHFMYDSIYFSEKKSNYTESKEVTKMDRTLFFDSHLSYPNPFIMTVPDGLMCFTLSVFSYCDYFQKIGLYKKYDTTKKASQKYNFPIVDDSMCGHISIPGWIKLNFEKKYINGRIFHGKHKNKKNRWGSRLINFEKIDTIWISTLYNDIIIPIDTNKTTTEKIPLPF